MGSAAEHWVIADIITAVAFAILSVFSAYYLVSLRYYIGAQHWYTLRARITLWITISSVLSVIDNTIKAAAFDFDVLHRVFEMLSVIAVFETYITLVSYWALVYHKTYRPGPAQELKDRILKWHVAILVLVSLATGILYILFIAEVLSALVFYAAALSAAAVFVWMLSLCFFVYGRLINRTIRESFAVLSSMGTRVSRASEDAFRRIDRVTTFCIAFFAVSAVVFMSFALMYLFHVFESLLFVMYIVYKVVLTMFPLSVLQRFFWQPRIVLKRQKIGMPSEATNSLIKPMNDFPRYASPSQQRYLA
eukprot:ANDGO_08179.mRNA.1 hypothetical protein